MRGKYVVMVILAALAIQFIWKGRARAALEAAAQQPGGAEAIRARSARDLDFQRDYVTEPGGTPEEKLWQVLVLMGVQDKGPTNWDGRLEISSGEVHDVQGYRFELPDRVLPQGGWEMSTQIVHILYDSPLAGQGSAASESRMLPKGLLVRGSGSESVKVSVATAQGRFSFRPMDMSFGRVKKHLGNRVEVHRIPPATDLSGTPLRQHDFPSIAAGGDDVLWVTWSSYHDRREELNFRRYKDGRWTRLIPVGRASEDLWRPQVATDETGKPWLIWSQQNDHNWDIYAMSWADNEWGELHRLSKNPLPDIEPHVAQGPDGVIYVVWQDMVGHHSQIQLKHLQKGKWSETVTVTSGASNNWEPAVAVGSDGRVWITWDRYNSSYDVYCRSYSPGRGLSEEMKVAATNRFEAHASVAVDPLNRPWIAWETAGVNWGKDLGAALGPHAPGKPLGGRRRIEVVVFDNNEWKTPASFAPKDTLGIGATGESRPLLTFDPDGNLWMSFKRRYSRRTYRPSVFWESYLTRLDANGWADPILLPNSWARKSTRMGLASSNGRLWAFWPSENRNYAFASRPLLNRVIAGSVVLPGKTSPPQLTKYQPSEERGPSVHPNEARDVSVIRNYRTRAAGKSLQIVRGDLHRHTEFSQDIGGLDDGSLPEFYRYMIDAAEMDFGASTDHQAGGTDYWNFITQKMSDMYHFPQRFVTLFAYERNLGNPHGHRNIIHTQRDYPIVPFFQRIDPRFMLPDTPDGELLTFNSMSFGSGIRNDTKLLYRELRKTGGLAIPHTSGTDSMGTDWGDNDANIDAVVEIYQGARQNYEHKNAPRGIKDGEESEALGGFQEPGVVWNAWKKGYRLGVVASSDHYSTHISYAMVYTPAKDRQEIFDAIRKRHTYGATDNIILEFRMGEHFMGDDFSTKQKQKIKIKVRGTDVVDAIHLIRDARYIYRVSPGKQEVEFEYVDNDVNKGEYWYYVRVEQKDGQLAWSSAIWVKYE
ncbi:hypothetical protein MYX65_05345 [Acidobacteria bacterium AH-259-L09]|nr:hypothetical protein [Acidobacteria bacterium AH-259-L09]